MDAEDDQALDHVHESTTAGKVNGDNSNDSGSLTQRAAMIRDELLGNDPREQDSGYASNASSVTSVDRGDHSGHRGSSPDDDEILEDDFSGSSGIAHSLRHIKMAFEEKTRELESLRQMQQAHGEQTEQLQAQIEKEKEENQALVAELEELNTFNAALRNELESLKIRLQEKYKLLCVSDRICSSLYGTIQDIKSHIQAAEVLLPAIRSLPASSSDNTNGSDYDSVESAETNPTSFFSSNVASGASTSVNMSRTSIDELITDIEARYAE